MKCRLDLDLVDLLHGHASWSRRLSKTLNLGWSLAQRRWDTRSWVLTFSSSPLPERMAKAAICGSASGRASKIMSSTPMGEVTFSKTRPSASSMRPSTCERKRCACVLHSESLKHTLRTIQVRTIPHSTDMHQSNPKALFSYLYLYFCICIFFF